MTPLRLGCLALVLTLGACARNYRLDDSAAVAAISAPQQVLRILWHKGLVQRQFLDFRPQEWSTALIDRDGRCFVGTSAGEFLALDARSGKLLWRFKAQGGIGTAAALDEATGALYFGADDGKLYALDASSGRLRWSYATQGTINRPPVFSEGFVLFTSSEGRIYALDAATGKWRWQYDREPPEGFTMHGYAGVAVKGSTAYTGFADGTLIALRVFSGDIVWTRSLRGDKKRFVDVDATPVIVGDRLLTASHSSGIYAVALENGSILWQYPVEGASSVDAHRQRVYFTAPRVGLAALSMNGHLLWRQAIARGVPSSPVAYGNYLFVTGSETGLYAVDATTGALLQYFDPGHGISAAPALAGGYAAALTNQGWLYLFGLPDASG